MNALNNGYVLVKDKDGRMKYLKDGKFYEISEIDNQHVKTENKKSLNALGSKQTAKISSKKLEPVFTYESKKKAEPVKSNPEVLRKVEVSEKPKVVTRVEPPIKKVENVKIKNNT